MAFHGNNGWGSDLAARNSANLSATTYDSGEPLEVVVVKKHNGLNRYLEFTLPEGLEGRRFMLTRDGVEDLKLFLE